ncbi:polysaccharide deacetylase family protein [Deinococcus pimensis]|uniref:polysaccharide deacetylase family protein n=1 Tax=Deinococcus pimensis TaxID=309888 RepID=UPI0005EBC2D7|nr:polysaccharide deacetylase family protein [Deinococcus pimensis]
MVLAHRRARGAALVALLLGVSAAPTTAPLPRVEPLGAAQPAAPGTRPAAAVPQLNLVPPVPEVHQFDVLDNGYIRVAHAVVLLGARQADLAKARATALDVVRRAFAQASDLAEVDVSVYARSGYQGFGGPPPLFTSSVPKDRLRDFERFVTQGTPYERVWPTGSATRVTDAPFAARTIVNDKERALRFLGSFADLVEQRALQAYAQLHGGVQGGQLFHGNPRASVAALTFDDAPHPLYMPLLLDLLRRADVKATFFVIGRNAAAYPYFVRDMAEQGHEVGNHTYHHVRLPGLSETQIRDELRRTNDTLRAITGRTVRFFRPPGGEYDARTLRLTARAGLTTTFWTDDPGDFANPGDGTVEARLTRHLRQGGIVLLHDNAREALEVLEPFTRVASARGVRLSTVTDLLASRNARPSPARGQATAR